MHTQMQHTQTFFAAFRRVIIFLYTKYRATRRIFFTVSGLHGVARRSSALTYPLKPCSSMGWPECICCKIVYPLIQENQ